MVTRKQIGIFFVIGSLVVGGAIQAYSIVFVHLGPTLPKYMSDALLQARIFNPTCEIVLLANRKALDAFVDYHNTNTTLIPVESIAKTNEHKEFIKKSTLKKIDQRENFWLFTSERFLYLDDYMQQHDKKDVFHLENDVLLYANLAEMLPTFTKYYKGLAAVFDNDDRCIASIVYIHNKKSLSPLSRYFATHASKGKNDMEILALFRQANGEKIIGSLPITPEAYHKKYSLKSDIGHVTTNPERYSNNISLFKSVFDGAAYGHYLGGQDPRNGCDKPGFVNESSLVNTSLLRYKWEKDVQGRNVPFMSLDGEEWYRINNLHIHSKRLGSFLSIPKNKFCPAVQSAVIPGYSEGRFGDNILAVAHALYFSMKNNCEMLYIPFPYSDELVLDDAVPLYDLAKAKLFTEAVTHDNGDVYAARPMKNTLITVPYFPDDVNERKKRHWKSFYIDWQDQAFKKELQRVLASKRPRKLINPPHDKFSVAVHMRRGGSYDKWPAKVSKLLLYKTPVDDYYINQIKTLAALINYAPMYAYIFTDDENPAALASMLQAGVNLPSVEFDYHRENNHHNTNVLEDFYSMAQCDALIRPDSNLSIMAEKIGNHRIVISPGKFLSENLLVQKGCIKINS